MTTISTSITEQQSLRTFGRKDTASLSFRRVLLSEWIKFRTLRSSFALLGFALFAMVGVSLLGSLGVILNSGHDARLTEQGVRVLPMIGLYFGQLVLAALAVMLITSEQSTGMIRSTMTAVPRRIPVLLAKGLLAATLGAAVGVIGAFAAHVLVQPILATKGLDYALDATGQWTSFGGTGLYLALVAIFALAVGMLLRNTAASIVTVVGLLFVLPIALSLIPGDVASTIVNFLPSEAGSQLMVRHTADGTLTQLQGGLILAAWAIIPFVAGILTIKRRDC